MKIASWNVNSIKARLPHVTSWLEAQAPDVLLLQELKGLEFPADAFEALGYQCAVVPQKAYNGVALLSRHDISVEHQALPGDSADEQARYIEATTGGIRIIGIYAPNGNPVDTEKFTYKLAWLDRLYTHLHRLRQDEVPFCIGGDFNIIPEPKDCYDPKAWEGDALFRPESRQKLRALINLGLTDAFRVFNHKAEQYTFWDYQGGAWPKNHGIRIDHFLLSPALTDQLKNCTIDSGPRGKDKASDHTPIIVELAA
ncbi:MAG: exodeoxyribonuclease III [Rhodospirillales bacterium]|nr:exodeoxyribonuclease III [Rhodospirillales bacterium]MCB9995029.1 exodeoxyribonuclease III [Rhodospirillales bacterium]